MFINLLLIISTLFFLFSTIYLFLRIQKDRQKLNEVNNILNSKMEELKLFKTIIDKADLAVAITDPYNKNKAIYINEKFENTTGYKKEEVIGKNLKFLQRNDKNQKAINKLTTALRDRKPCQVQLRNYRKDGTKYENLLSVSPIFDEKGKLLCHTGVQYDITNLKQDEQIQAQKHKLDSMKELLHNIAHQWRQPLSVISVEATGMKIKQEYEILEPDMIIESCNEIVKNTDHLSHIIEDFTTIVNTGSKGDVVYHDKNNTSKFINLIDSTITEHGINLILDLNESDIVKGYSDELIECFVNIFNNSKDAVVAKHEEYDRYIFISQWIDNDNLVVEFKDNGGGIEEKILPKIFDPYFTTKHQAQGTGLGLHIVYSIIHDLGGKVEVQNDDYELRGEKFRGAVFKITLPIS